jgi:hypothetical protein
VFAFFSVQGGFLPPPPPHRHSEAYYTRPAFRLPITHSATNPTAGVGEAASPKDWQSVTFTCHNRPTAYGGQAAISPVKKLIRNPACRRTFPQ